MLRFLIALMALFLLPTASISAEVLQVSSSDTLLIGDNNRSYKVKIACIELDPSQQDNALNWLRKKLPRKTRVNLKPKAFNEGSLVANLIDIKSNKNIAISMEEEGFGTFNCF